ncbi:MAG: hypothetical protein GXO60_00435 [Epsilonproteobacteria bacterium]|nr:hypothetical protein [Campylobacterota bacterium]
MKKSLALSAITATILLLGVGCGGGSSSSSDDSSDISTLAPIETKTGYYLDSAVVGINYECTSNTDGEENITTSGITDENGSFAFIDGQICTFSIAGVTLREVNTTDLPDNGIVVEDNLDVARFLQTLDNDNNPDNGIVIDSNVSKTLESLNVLPEESIPATDEDLANLAIELQEKVPTYHGEMVTEEEAKAHLEETIATVREMNGVMEVHQDLDDNESYSDETNIEGLEDNSSDIVTDNNLVDEVNSTTQSDIEETEDVVNGVVEGNTTLVETNDNAEENRAVVTVDSENNTTLVETNNNAEENRAVVAVDNEETATSVETNDNTEENRAVVTVDSEDGTTSVETNDNAEENRAVVTVDSENNTTSVETNNNAEENRAVVTVDNENNTTSVETNDNAEENRATVTLDSDSSVNSETSTSEVDTSSYGTGRNTRF